MNSIVSALDKRMSTKKLGENGHVENCWSFNQDELVVQFFFQLVRTKDTSILEQKLEYLLQNLTFSEHHNTITILYKLIGQTRDLVEGKGECDLTWMQLEVWYRYYPDLAFKAFLYCVDSRHDALNGHQYGSWKDIKYFLSYLKHKVSEDHPLVERILREIAIPALKRDEKLLSEGKPVSLIGRWIPREKSSKKFNWLFKKLSKIMYPEFAVRPPGGWKNREQQSKSSTKQQNEQVTQISINCCLLARYMDTYMNESIACGWCIALSGFCFSQTNCRFLSTLRPGGVLTCRVVYCPDFYQ